MKNLIAVVAPAVCLVVGITAAAAQMSPQDLRRMDEVAAQAQQMKERLGPRAKFASSGLRNLLNLGGRWSQIRASLAGAPAVSPAALAPQTLPPKLPLATIGVSDPSADLGTTRFSGFTQSETSTAWCGSTAVVAFNDSGSYVQTLPNLFKSTNGGASIVGYSAASGGSSSTAPTTFTDEGYPALAGTGVLMLGDPGVACNSVAYYLSSLWYKYSSSGSLTNTGVSVSQSSLSGDTPPLPVFTGAPIGVVSAPYPQHEIDKPWLAVDSQSNLYLVYTDFDDSGSVCGSSTSGKRKTIIAGTAIVLASRISGNWSTRTIDEECGVPFVQGGQVAIAPNGTVDVAWEYFNTNGGSTYSQRSLWFTSSASSYTTKVQIGSVNYVGDSTDLQGAFRVVEFPSLAIDPSNSNKVYVAWNDGGKSVADSLSPTGAYQFADILVAESSDGGSTWWKTAANQGSIGDATDEYQPAIAVNDAGTVEVCYYDRHSDPNNFLIQRSCASANGYGASFGAPVQIAPSAGSPGWASVIGQDYYIAFDYMGDYDSLAVDATRTNTTNFLGAFGDNAAGNPDVQAAVQ